MREVLVADQKLVILRFLAEIGGYSSNDSIIDDVLSNWSHNISRDLVRNRIHWLEEQGLVTVVPLGKTLIATLTQRGLDVAKGLAYCEGVKRPSPGA